MARTTHAPRGARLLRALGVVGWDHLEPVILAALATESPLLLVGPHGSAKTLVLTRLAQALGLAHRHYNASLLNFDDLIGFPVPDQGKLAYLQTPATIWDAESVLFDEISRCRPELQNKLFPIVHERIVQGVPLDRLRHRWGAMNPPPSQDGGDDGPDYAGAEPLDIALADRFAFIVRVPGLAELGRADQLAVLRGAAGVQDGPVDLAERLEQIRAAIAATDRAFVDAVAEYVQVVAQKLGEAGHPVSTRRAVQVSRNIRFTHAALTTDAHGTPPAPEDAFFLALRHSLPDETWGRPVPHVKLLAAHRSAWALAKLDDASGTKAILLERDPVRRVALALAAPPSRTPAAEAGQIAVDAWSSLPRLARLATAAVLGPLLTTRGDLPVACLEPIAADYAALARESTAQLVVRNGGADWRRQLLSSDLARLPKTTERGMALTNAAIVLMQEDEPFALDALEAAYDHAAEAARTAGLVAPLGQAKKKGGAA